MPNFAFTATTTDGKQTIMQAQVTATDAQAAEDKVKAMFSQPVSVTLVELPPSNLLEVPEGRNVMGRSDPLRGSYED
ncbi:hypothetical protein ACIP1T_24905 [Pseudomonas japonica]|uniref:hypothetical protein n=1 Tax=Pseudomonas japonica TaxID=256466 RepID=UPI0037FD6113